MPRLIFKCSYIKGGGKRAASHLNNYVNYMATRPSAERVEEDRRPATKKQQEMVRQLLREFPLSQGMHEYQDYQASPTRANATEFISRALEENVDVIAKKENYLQYIAQRPNVQTVGPHGLFSSIGDPLVLSKVAKEVAEHPGNVWLPIISLRREDAARLGYDDVKSWQALLTENAMQIAEAMKIPWDQFRWYAAFHNQGHHPHVHMVCYSADPKYGYLSQESMEQLRSMLARQIFRQDLTEVYQQQTQRRDDLVQISTKSIDELIRQIKEEPAKNERIGQLLEQLAKKLRHTSGKKQYGYLRPPVKALVDEIVDELSKDPRIAAAYDLWYNMREDVLRTYRDKMPKRLPMSHQKEFKQIKNRIIQEAVRLGNADPAAWEVWMDDTTSDNTDVIEEQKENDTGETSYSVYVQAQEYRMAKAVLRDEQSSKEERAAAFQTMISLWDEGYTAAAYQLGKEYLNGDDVEKNVKKAVALLTAAAEKGNEHAQFELGKLYLLGKDIPRDMEAAHKWLTASAAQSNKYAQYYLDHMNDIRKTPLIFAVADLFYHFGTIFQEQVQKPTPIARFTDRKLMAKIREKKIALGHKPDDHENPTMA